MKQTKKEKMNEKTETNKGKYHTTYIFLKKNRFKKEKNKIESKKKRKKTYNNERKKHT